MFFCNCKVIFIHISFLFCSFFSPSANVSVYLGYTLHCPACRRNLLWLPTNTQIKQIKNFLFLRENRQLYFQIIWSNLTITSYLWTCIRLINGEIIFLVLGKILHKTFCMSIDWLNKIQNDVRLSINAEAVCYEFFNKRKIFLGF